MIRVIVVLALLADTVVNASPKPVTAASLYTQGETQFRGGQIDAAIESFSSGYALEPRPEFLLNLAQCYRALGRRSEAIDHLERFIRAAPDHPLRASAERTLEELRRAEVAERIALAPPPVAPQPRPAQPVPTQHRDGHRQSHTWQWVTAGAVVVLGGATAVYFATRSGSRVDDTIRLPPP